MSPRPVDGTVWWRCKLCKTGIIWTPIKWWQIAIHDHLERHVSQR